MDAACTNFRMFGTKIDNRRPYKADTRNKANTMSPSIIGNVENVSISSEVANNNSHYRLIAASVAFKLPTTAKQIIGVMA
jgi:hypothetical protein